MEPDGEFFDAGIYRVGTQSTKWDGIRKDCGKDDIVPLWVADMDFPARPRCSARCWPVPRTAPMATP